MTNWHNFFIEVPEDQSTSNVTVGGPEEEIDEELAMALRMSLEEEQARQEKESEKSLGVFLNIT